MTADAWVLQLSPHALAAGRYLPPTSQQVVQPSQRQLTTVASVNAELGA